jgi:hypothetical protein
MFKYVNEIFRIKYDQRVIIRFLYNERIDTHDITQRFQVYFAQDAYAVRIVQFWIGEVHRDRQHLHDKNRIGRLSLDDLDAKIVAILDKSPFESARSRAETFRMNLRIVLRRLPDSIGFRSFHLHWVSYVSTVGLCEKRMEYAQAMLSFLHAAE